jgi:hypothetical protein
MKDVFFKKWLLLDRIALAQRISDYNIQNVTLFKLFFSIELDQL